MTPGERSRLNSPISARQRVEKELKARAGGAEGDLRSSPVTIYKRRITELEREIAELKTRSADGGLLDLKRDTAKAIVAVMLAPGNLGDAKATEIGRELLAGVKKRQKPAG